MLPGAHVPTRGGLQQAPHNGHRIGAEAIQVFTRNQVQWAARPISGAEQEAFRQALKGSGVRQVLCHGSYLVNLASPDAAARRRSRSAFLAEMKRCHALGIRHLIFHPGAHMGAGERAGLRTLTRSLDQVLDQASTLDVMPLLEVTAGQGTYLGHRFEHLAEVIAAARHGDRLGVCLDTCHMLAAGYDIASARGYAATFREFERVVGLDRLHAFHLNDARQGLGSHLDRHAPLGAGHVGLAAFRRLVNDARFQGLPMILETPGGLEAWEEELALLRRLRKTGRKRR